MRTIGRVCLVTGAAGGLGKAIALGLASVGSGIIVLNRDGCEAEKVAREITASGRSTIALEAEVADEARIRRVLPEKTIKTIDMVALQTPGGWHD